MEINNPCSQPYLVPKMALLYIYAIPAMIQVSGLSGSKETAQEQVLIGMGLLAGSTVMLLTLLWGSCILVEKCDPSENSVSINSQDTRAFSLTGSRVSTDVETSHAAKIMTVSVIPFIIAQLPTILKTHAEDRLAVLVAFIVAVLFLLSYCMYQIYQPWIQKRRLAYAKHKHVISGILSNVQRRALGRLLKDDGTPNVPVIEKLFEVIDHNNDGLVSSSELIALIIGIQFDEIGLDEADTVHRVMEELDTSRDGRIDVGEFTEGFCKWLHLFETTVPHDGPYSNKLLNFHYKTREEHDLLIEGSDEVVETDDNPTWTIFKAVLYLLLGTVIALAFADPLVDAISNFSAATRIPSFCISFIALPLATNSGEAVSAIIFASRKKQRTPSLTFSEIYGGVTMNNTLCLAVFLAIVYLRGLTWEFSSEVLVILIVCIVMGLFTSFRTTFPLWTCLVAYLLYPLSLALIYVLDYVFGWS